MKLLVSSHFIEPCITGSEQQLEKLLKWLTSMNYRGCIIDQVDTDLVAHLHQSIPSGKEFLLFTRKTIDSPKRNPSDINKFRNDNDFIVFYSTNPELTKWACQDQRIDCLKFPLTEIHQLVDDSTIAMAKDNDKAIEIDFSELLKLKNPIGLLRNIKKVFHRAVNKKLPILLSSHAHNVYALKSSYSIIGFLAFLDVPEQYYLEISQEWLLRKLMRNKKRRKNNFIAPGIWLQEKEETNE